MIALVRELNRQQQILRMNRVCLYIITTLYFTMSKIYSIWSNSNSMDCCLFSIYIFNVIEQTSNKFEWLGKLREDRTQKEKQRERGRQRVHLPCLAHRRFSVGKSVGRVAHRDSFACILLFESICKDRSIIIRLQISL